MLIETLSAARDMARLNEIAGVLIRHGFADSVRRLGLADNPNRVDQGQMLSLEDIKDILRIKLIGVIPESEVVLQASNQGVPAVHMQGSDVSEAYKDVIDRFLGQDKPLRFVDAQKPGFLKRLFGGK